MNIRIHEPYVGLCGLAAALVWGASVVLTDLGPIVPGLEVNATLNHGELLRRHGAEVVCGMLDWTKPDEIRLGRDGFSTVGGGAAGEDVRVGVLSPRTHPVDVILAADTVYAEEHPELLTRTILTWLKAGPGSRVLITYPARIAYLDQIRDLWERLEGCGLAAVEDGKVSDASEDWDEEAYYEWSVWKWR